MPPTLLQSIFKPLCLYGGLILLVYLHIAFESMLKRNLPPFLLTQQRSNNLARVTAHLMSRNVIGYGKKDKRMQGDDEVGVAGMIRHQGILRS
jgi:hypothetical protein